MSSAFMDMNMEVGMEENPFEDGGMTAESPERKKSGIPDGFIDSADAFGENPFEPVMEPAAACLPVQEEASSDGACEEPEENECLETDAAEDAEETDKTEESNTEVSDTEKESEDKKRAEHEAAEARRKAEWEARQQAKKDAEKAQMERIMAMGEEELISESESI